MVKYFVGVDVGGTFTDIVVAGTDGSLVTDKVVTTPSDPRVGVAAGIEEVLEAAGRKPEEITRLVHGTTLATNVILEQRGGPIAFVVTEGFGDLLELGREARVEEERFDLFFTTPRPPVERSMTFEVRERLDARGEVVVALDETQLKDVVTKVAELAPAGVAVCFMHAYANADHERRAGEALRAALPPETTVVTSSEVWPEMREYERAMTTVMCAYVGPVMTQYLIGLEVRLAEMGIRCPVEIMESNGGVMSAALAAKRPVSTVESGGAAGVIASGFIGGLLGADEVISFDMGGTTAKAGIVREGRPQITHDFQIGGKGSFGGTRPGTGFPIKIPVVDLAEVGAGGGSIAWIDNGGALRVGPRSSGAVPGPACYGRGGTNPTVTDANLLLGYLNPVHLAGGVNLSVDLSEAAIDKVAGPLGLDRAETARAIHEVVNANMAAAIRVVTVQRGIDPRGFTLVGFGGAGPMHVARLAETFNITSVAVPFGAGVASAIGLMTSDLSVDEVRTRLMDEGEMDAGVITAIYDELVDVGRAKLPPGDDSALVVVRSADVRYRGQAHQLTVPVPDGALSDDDVAAVVKTFGEHYRQTYGIEADAPVQLVNYRVRVIRIVDKYQPAPSPDAPESGQVTERKVYFPELGGFVDTPVHQWLDLRPGNHVSGPAIVEGPDTTVVVPPAFEATVDRWRSVLLSSNK
jgi:N-methylhydantoinase A